MGDSLQDALKKAGLKASRSGNEHKRQPKPKGNARPKAIEKHQQHQTFCDCCKKTAPDVEYYKHKNPALEARWLCIICADNHFIPDDTRQSNQSGFAMRGMFRRRYGKTKVF